MARAVLALLAALLVLAAAPATPRPAAPHALPTPRFDRRNAMAILAEIAGDGMAGRKSGLPSGRRAEEYVALRFKVWGLKPAGQNNTFFQTFSMLATDERAASMELLDSPYGRVAFLYDDDFTPVTNSGSGDVTAEVVVAGHGLSDAARRWDDYGDLDVRGKIVLIVRGTPENGYDWDQDGSRDSTLQEAVRRGAASVLFLQESRPVHGGAVHEGAYFPGVPVAYIGYRVADLIFMGTGVERAAYEKGLSAAPHPFSTGKRLRVSMDIVHMPGGLARNVLGRVNGSDPRLRDEILVVGGHMDHLGVNARGLVYNGADDNGSGTAVVMELARAIASSPKAPRRTIVFATFAGEEQGLLGAEALVKQPTFDLHHAVGMINIDMAGRGNGKAGIGGGEQFPEAISAFRALLDSTLAESLGVHHAWGGEGSDHAPFRRAGIPTVNVWSEGEHLFYHRLDDDVAWIDAAVLAGTGRMAERWIRFLADWPEPLANQRRAGRALLYESCQIDLDGADESALPHYVAGGVHWFDARGFGGESFLSALNGMAGEDAAGGPALAAGLPGVKAAAWQGKRARLIGLDGTPAVAAVRGALLHDLHVSLVRAPARAELATLAAEGVAILVAPDTAWISALPPGSKGYLRVFANRGERIENPDAYPRRRFAFIVSLDGPPSRAGFAQELRGLGWDRVHLDLVPWIEREGEEPVWTFLEQLQATGLFEQRHLRAMLGGNLERM